MMSLVAYIYIYVIAVVGLLATGASVFCDDSVGYGSMVGSVLVLGMTEEIGVELTADSSGQGLNERDFQV